jgi:hypothetical protein
LPARRSGWPVPAGGLACWGLWGRAAGNVRPLNGRRRSRAARARAPGGRAALRGKGAGVRNGEGRRGGLDGGQASGRRPGVQPGSRPGRPRSRPLVHHACVHAPHPIGRAHSELSAGGNPGSRRDALRHAGVTGACECSPRGVGTPLPLWRASAFVSPAIYALQATAFGHRRLKRAPPRGSFKNERRGGPSCPPGGSPGREPRRRDAGALQHRWPASNSTPRHRTIAQGADVLVITLR